jgi:glucosyl-dolichyl phosphate glucuronosyltransferase
MKITVAICTWNRSELLKRTMSQMAEELFPPRVDWELLVVNNNCTDDTESVVESFQGRLPIRQIVEQKQGLSFARNAAVSCASGDYILWTDDDVIVDSGWLAAYESAFARYPEAAFFGGPIQPWFEGMPPRWMATDAWSLISTAFAALDYGTRECKASCSRLPFGANYAIRLDWQRRHLYDPRFGRRPETTISGEETIVLLGIIKEGGTGWWIPDAQVRHWIPKSRQSLAYLREYYAGYGRTLNRQSSAGAYPLVFGKPRWLLRHALESELAYCLHRLYAPPMHWISDLKKASIAWGQLQDFRKKEPSE